MAGPWLYPISAGAGRSFTLADGQSIPVTVDSFRRLIENGQIVEDLYWVIGQNWNKIQIGDEVFVYTGDEDLGIIGYATVSAVEQRGDSWFILPQFNLGRSRALLETPVPAAIVREWIPFPRRSPLNLAAFVEPLRSHLPWSSPGTRTGPHIDSYLFQQQLEAFRSFVRDESGIAFVSFASNPYTEEQEGYKYAIHRAARDALEFQDWTQAYVGTGRIISATIAAIELPENNLLTWQPRFGEDARIHRPLLQARDDPNVLRQIEQVLFQLYHDEQDQDTFARLVSIVGKRYPLLAYLFFLKDRSRYLPIAPSSFDRGFELLGAEFKTSHQCSWDNYATFIALINELKSMLTESLRVEVTLLDAHSFIWMLANQMDSQNRLADVRNYLGLSASEREAVIRARVGQGRFRQSLIDYWSRCAVTGCAETGLLRASHIKPWAEATLEERLSLYNGLLLSPALDAAFDCGYVSFDDEGRILISPRLSGPDAAALSIHRDMRLSRVETEHKRYLAVHRSKWGFEAGQNRQL